MFSDKKFGFEIQKHFRHMRKLLHIANIAMVSTIAAFHVLCNF